MTQRISAMRSFCKLKAHRAPIRGVMRRQFLPGLLMLGALLAQAGGAAPGAVSPTKLKCEHRVNLLGIDATPPRLSWNLESRRRGEGQTAWQILAASTPARLARNQGDPC